MSSTTHLTQTERTKSALVPHPTYMQTFTFEKVGATLVNAVANEYPHPSIQTFFRSDHTHHILLSPLPQLRLPELVFVRFTVPSASGTLQRTVPLRALRSGTPQI